MRIWDLPVDRLCQKHLLGEHSELHALWTILTQNRRGYSRHPETLRWKGKLKALFLRHQLQVKEMEKRGYHHQSHLDPSLATGSSVQDELVDTLREQEEILRKKNCRCRPETSG
jgi:hypothetical protein